MSEQPQWVFHPQGNLLHGRQWIPASRAGEAPLQSARLGAQQGFVPGYRVSRRIEKADMALLLSAMVFGRETSAITMPVRQ
jgi:hypothetical protein